MAISPPVLPRISTASPTTTRTYIRQLPRWALPWFEVWFVRPGEHPHKSGPRRSIAAAKRIREGKRDRKSTRLNSSHGYISYAVFCLKKTNTIPIDRGAPLLAYAVVPFHCSLSSADPTLSYWYPVTACLPWQHITCSVTAQRDPRRVG